MNNNINMYRQVAHNSLTGKDLNIKVFKSLKTWLNGVINDRLSHIEKLNSLNKAIELSVAILENMNHEINSEERETITNIINLIIKKCMDSISKVEDLNNDSFKEEFKSIDLIIELITG